MAWINLTFFAEEKDIDLLSEVLETRGALSIFIQDKNLNNSDEELIFGEPHSGPNKFWATNQIQALFNDSEDIKKIQDELASNFQDIDFKFTASSVSETDWVKLSQSQFKPICIKDRINIVPSWHKINNPKLINIILDPGLAFGTGAHPTTHLCTEWLIDNVSSTKKVLDYGCGSGILAIAAYKLGAKEVKGVDIDPQAIFASKENGAVNECDIDWLNTDKDFKFQTDLLVANILSSALSVLAPLLASYCAPKGKIALSGILESQENQIKKIYAPWFIFEQTLKNNGWVCLSGVKV
ncbi:50S ribosomal protein L11 methyltransferase [Methylophilaceae bacterium]|nr:50S ribosomal protein L11 methyltransferase [Methylophilaceae bacterium]